MLFQHLAIGFVHSTSSHLSGDFDKIDLTDQDLAAYMLMAKSRMSSSQLLGRTVLSDLDIDMIGFPMMSKLLIKKVSAFGASVKISRT